MFFRLTSLGGNHRDEVRAQYLKDGTWPAKVEERPNHQLVRHLTPAAFSPLH